MIDRDTLRTARRTVERNGFTVLPPRDRDERELNRFRTRREVEREDSDSRPNRPAPRFRDTVEQDEPRRFKPLRQRVYNDDYEDERRPARPVRKEMNDDEKLGAAIRTAEENGFTIRKMSKLDQAKQVARDNGFDVRKVDGEDRRTVPGRAQRPLVRPKANPSVNDGIRTRTAPDTEIKNDTKTQTETPADTKKTYADDFMDRAARFFGEEE